MYNIPDSPTWVNPSSPSSTDSSFHGNTIYNVSNNVTYGQRSSQADSRWSVSSGDSMTSWSGQSLPSAHNASVRRREHNMLQDSWPSIQTTSSRWQDSSSLGISGSGYSERSRIRPGHPYESPDSSRRDPEGRPRDQRIGWSHHRESSSHSSRERRSPQSSFTPSPTLPFSSYSTPSYTSAWTPENGLMTTPTLHSIGSYENGGYSSTGNTTLNEEFAQGVEEYTEA